MTRKELILSLLAASEGRPYTPVQLQKAVFLVTQNVPDIIDQGPTFTFVPYDYGPFDSEVYAEASSLKLVGHAVVAPSSSGRWSTYAASDTGVVSGREILRKL